MSGIAQNEGSQREELLDSQTRRMITVTPNEYPHTLTTVTISVHPSPRSPSFASQPKRQNSEALLSSDPGIVLIRPMIRLTKYRPLEPHQRAAKKARHLAYPSPEPVG